MGGDEGTILVLKNKSLKKKGLTNKETILVNLEFPFFGLLNIRQPRDHTIPNQLSILRLELSPYCKVNFS